MMLFNWKMFAKIYRNLLFIINIYLILILMTNVIVKSEDVNDVKHQLNDQINGENIQSQETTNEPDSHDTSHESPQLKVISNNDVNSDIKLIILSKVSSDCSSNGCDKSQNNDNVNIKDNNEIIDKTEISDSKLQIESQSSSSLPSPQILTPVVESNESKDEPKDNGKGDDDKDIPLPPLPSPVPPSDMLSFEEWRKKIAEINENAPVNDVNKKQTPSVPVPQPSDGSGHTPNKTVLKKTERAKRGRNFASYECGAKVVDANPEAESVLRILNEQADEYMLNPCKTKIWFIIELCEAVHASHIELANYELFSSLPKEFNLYACDHYPTREWSYLGTYTAADVRSLQTFEVKHEGFVKFFKVELFSYYGTEHFCPLSVFRVFGTSLFEEVERMDSDTVEKRPEMDLDESDPSFREEMIGTEQSSQNLFGTARDAVYNIVRKAAAALNGNAQKEMTKSDDSALAMTENEKIAIQLFSVVNKYLWKCLNVSVNNSMDSNVCVKPNVICMYLNAIFGTDLFDLLTREMTLNSFIDCDGKVRAFQCPKKFIRNGTKENVGTDTTIDDKSITDAANKLNNNLLTPSLVPQLTLTPETSTVVNTEQSVTSSIVIQIPESVNTIDETIPKLTPLVPQQTTDTIDASTIVDAQTQFNNNVSSSIVVDNENGTKEGSKIEEIVKHIPNNLTQSDPSQSNINHLHVNANVHTNGLSSGLSSAVGQSVVLRLSNRIKALEVNLSLSSQYLEELSQRYRRQMEEMQRAFTNTINKMNDTARKAAERDIKQNETIAALQTKVTELSNKVTDLMIERETVNWYFIEIHIGLMLIEVIIVVVILQFCVRLMVNRLQTPQFQSVVPQREVHVSFNSDIPLSPYKRPNPIKLHHTPAKTKRVDDDVFTFNPNEPVSVDAPIKNRKRKKKHPNQLMQINVQSSAHHANQLKENNETIVKRNHIMINKSVSSPVLNVKCGSTNGSNKSHNSSCHSSTSGISSVSALSDSAFTNSPVQLTNTNVKLSTISLPDTKKSESVTSHVNQINGKLANDKSHIIVNGKSPNDKSSTFSFKKFLKIDKK